MNKLLIVAPNHQLYVLTSELLRETGINAEVFQATSATVVDTVRHEMEGHTGVVLARGHQAQLLKHQTDIPVVEITLSAQDMAVLMNRASAMVEHPQPRIAFVGFRYMFSNCAEIAAIMNIDMRIEYASSGTDVPEVVHRAVTDGAEVIIGGEIACHAAEELGIKSLFMDSARESILNGIRNAMRTLEALEQEQRRSAELSSLLNYSFDAVIRLDNNGNIISGNHLARKALHLHDGNELGQPLLSLEGLQITNELRDALKDGSNLYSTVIRMGHDSFISNVAALNPDGKPDGFIITMQEFSAIDDLETAIRQERKRHGYIARKHFDDYKPMSTVIRALYADAKRVAPYDVPVLICGEPGQDKLGLAECIHNASIVQNNPFVAVDLSTVPVATQMEYLFGTRDLSGQLTLAEKGTLFLLDVHLLTEESQHQLLNILRNKHYLRRGSHSPVPVNVRVICSTYKDLFQLVQAGKFMEPLASTLMGMPLYFPSISDTPEEIPQLLENCLDITAEKYKKSISFTQDAMELLCSYSWPGNLREIDQFCQRATILADKYLVDAAFIRSHLQFHPEAEHREIVIVADHEESELRDALRRNHGDRSKAAEELGISRSTLWRKMKKYHLC